MSRATETTVPPSGSISVCSACHPGRAVLQPHQLAQAIMMILRPRSDAKSKPRPIASMSDDGNRATAVARVRPVAVAPPSDHTPCSVSWTIGMPSRAAAVSMLTAPLSSAPGAGTHTSPRHMPSGLASQPVTDENSEAGTRRLEKIMGRLYAMFIRVMCRRTTHGGARMGS